MTNSDILLKWEPVARETFFGYRDDSGRGVPDDVMLRLHVSEGTFADPRLTLLIGWQFFRDGIEFNTAMLLSLVNSEDDIRKLAISNAQDLAKQCLIALEARAA